MTTRITLAILLTTWIILIVGETAAFLTAQQSLLALLDDTIITRATRLVEASFGPPEPGAAASVPQGDRYEIRNGSGEVIDHTIGDLRSNVRPTMVRKGFEIAPDGKRVRTITLQTVVSRGGQKIPMSITYSRPTERFDWLMTHLAGMLLLISLACGLTTAWLALKLSRAALRPLTETAEVISEIDESNLSRRINPEAMPPELAAMAERLNEMLARLENGFQERKRFLADAAHELRTPTAALLTTMEVALRRPREHSELIATLQVGLEDARRLRKLVEQLMEHARSEHVRGSDTTAMVEVGAIVRECIEVVTPLAHEKGVTIEHDLSPSSGFTAQRDRIRSIAMNLLSNAVEYNRPGGSVRVVCTHKNGILRLIVADTGQGIAPDQLPHLFQPFYRGGNGRGDDPTHLGLGLALVRSHVEALHGQCEVESKLGEGTNITITLTQDRPVPRGSRDAVTASSLSSAV